MRFVLKAKMVLKRLQQEYAIASAIKTRPPNRTGTLFFDFILNAA